MDNQRTKILSTIRSMARIADPEHGASIGEMSNASALMQKLMDKYLISMAEVMAEDIGSPEKEFAYAQKSAQAILGKLRQWHWVLARLVGRITHTRHFSTSQRSEEARRTTKGKKLKYGSTMAFYGHEQNVNLACDLYDDWLVRLTSMASNATEKYKTELLFQLNEEAKRLGEDLITDLYRRDLGNLHPNTYRMSWLLGCLQAMNMAVYEEEDKREEITSTAIVLYDNNLKDAWIKYSSGMQRASNSSKENRVNWEGMDDGASVGKGLKIDRKELS